MIDQFPVWNVLPIYINKLFKAFLMRVEVTGKFCVDLVPCEWLQREIALHSPVSHSCSVHGLYFTWWLHDILSIQQQNVVWTLSSSMIYTYSIRQLLLQYNAQPYSLLKCFLIIQKCFGASQSVKCIPYLLVLNPDIQPEILTKDIL